MKAYYYNFRLFSLIVFSMSFVLVLSTKSYVWISFRKESICLVVFVAGYYDVHDEYASFIKRRESPRIWSFFEQSEQNMNLLSD